MKPNSAGVLSAPPTTEQAAALLAELTLDEDSERRLNDVAKLLELLNEELSEDFEDFDDFEDFNGFDDLEDLEDFAGLDDLTELDDFTDLVALLVLLLVATGCATAPAGAAITSARTLVAIRLKNFMGIS